MPRIAIRHGRLGDPGPGDPPAAAGLTLGVEEEFLLLDPATGATLPRAAGILAADPPLPPGARLHRELRATQVEAATGVCTGARQLREQLVRSRKALTDTARLHGAVVASCGTPVLSGPSTSDNQDGRFGDIDRIYRGMVADYEACGCHVHVGVPDPETAVAVMNHLRPWLPTLLALSVNSPFDHGRDTGYGSWRMVQQSRFPGAGIPPYFPDLAAYRAEVRRLVDCGALVDESMSFWLVRPSTAFPTLEFRVADAASTVDEAVLQAVLSRALVRRALAADTAPPEMSEQVGAAALWAAARDGIDGEGVHPLQARRVPAWELVKELAGFVAPALDETGDRDLVAIVLERLRHEGSGARRQRKAVAGGLPALLATLTNQG
ncbi:carboxylate-amine ligase [Amycolatopsis methanolica]|uniref:Putative glutamate--cysteine ligase 2 n=1 Tax=Amycolatopsis methanolica 239 TaxID=1068978 RepID=A0A076MW95_AMYME|nr:glutamate--cysteine ligase [Amycolatopsis methanolica]AIJ25004.1 glutamate--cysteine ligase GCS2 [Amycolatopsis methanolica 239]